MELGMTTLADMFLFWGIKAIVAVVIFFVGKVVAKYLCQFLRNALRRSHVEETLVIFVGNICHALLITMVVIAALTHVGVQTTSLVAVIGAAGLAVALALQGSLSNFAAGVMLIIFRPFKVGDFIEAAGVSGVVEEVEIFTTQMRSGDNRSIVVPNSKITTGIIINYSAKSTRRIDLVIGVSYAENLGHVRDVIESILSDDERILPDPAPTIGVSALGESSVDFVVRPWVASSDYWKVRFDLNKRIKERFDDENISIPFPQRDVNLYQRLPKTQGD